MEVMPAGDHAKGQLFLPGILLSTNGNTGAPIVLEPLDHADDWMPMVFADARRFEQEGKKKSVYPFSARLRLLRGNGRF